MKKTLLSLCIAVGAWMNVQAQAVIYSADFTGGVQGWATPGGTSNGAASANAIWKWDLNGSNGFYASPNNPITSATAATGFMILDSDSLDNGNMPDPSNANSAWFGHGPAPSPQQASLESPVINCSGQASVRIKFSQFFRNFQADCYVIVSNDGGLSWTSFPVNTSIAANAATGTNDLVDINISSVAANQSNVKVGFYWDGDYYYWMVDDVTVYASPATDDIRIVDVYDMEYDQIPVSQADTINFTGEYFNEGGNICNNLVMNVSITGAGSFSGNTNPALGTVYSGVDTFSYVGGNFYGDYLPSAKGNYNAVYTISSAAGSDVTPGDNVKNRSWQLSDSTYAQDVNTPNGNGYPLYRTSDSKKFIIGDFYNLPNADTVSSISAAFIGGSNLTAAGGVVQANIYTYDANASAWVLYLTSYQVTLTGAMISSSTSLRWVKFNFPMGSAAAVNGLILPAGSYIVALEALSTTSNVYVMTNSGSSLSRSFVYDDVTYAPPAGNNVAYIAYGTTSCVRMNFGHNFPKFGGIENINNLNLGTVYPNPSTVGSTITIPSATNGVATLKVYNAIGDVVAAKEVNLSKNITIETTAFNPGLYVYTIEQNGKKSTGKFTLMK